MSENIHDLRQPIINCKCSYFAQDGQLLMLGHLHHPGCEYADGSRERVAAKIIRDLVKGIDNWAADEDGDVHADCWKAYKAARYAIGDPVVDSDEAPAKGV
jgi:hypothetical protein